MGMCPTVPGFGRKTASVWDFFFGFAQNSAVLDNGAQTAADPPACGWWEVGGGVVWACSDM